MVELIVAITVVVILSLIIYDIRKKASKKAASETKATGTAKQAQTIKQDNKPVLQTELKADEPVFDPDPSIKPTSNTAILETESRKRGHLTQDSVLKTEPEADESVLKTESQSVHSEEIQHVEPVFDPDSSIEPTSNTATLATSSSKYEHLPEDSMLRRHYLTHLFGMIESTRSSLPTDSALSSHYDAMIIAEMEECLSSETEMDQLVRDYEEYKKSLALQTQKSKAIAPSAIEPIATAVNPKLPEDSMLRRHHLTYIRALVESKAPQCPTDSTLRRHYETMIENEINKLL